MMDLGGKPLSGGNKKLAKNLTQSLAKKLACRGILLDYNVISNVSPEAAVAAAESDDVEGQREKEENALYRRMFNGS